MLFNERMLESYIHARKWLKPRGRGYLGLPHLASSFTYSKVKFVEREAQFYSTLYVVV